MRIVRHPEHALVLLRRLLAALLTSPRPHRRTRPKRSSTAAPTASRWAASARSAYSEALKELSAGHRRVLRTARQLIRQAQLAAAAAVMAPAAAARHDAGHRGSRRRRPSSARSHERPAQARPRCRSAARRSIPASCTSTSHRPSARCRPRCWRSSRSCSPACCWSAGSAHPQPCPCPPPRLRARARQLPARLAGPRRRAAAEPAGLSPSGNGSLAGTRRRMLRAQALWWPTLLIAAVAVLRHVLRKRRAEPRIDDHDRDRADARRRRESAVAIVLTRGPLAVARRVRTLAGRAAARVHRADARCRSCGRCSPTAAGRTPGGCSPTAPCSAPAVALVRLAPERWPAMLGGLDAGGGGRVRLRAADQGLPGHARRRRAATCTRAWRNRTATGTRSA